jgi:hypothetical protein
MGIKGLWKDIERGVKDIRGKDVPESPLRDHVELKELLQSLANYIEKKALDLLKKVVEKMWPVAQEWLTREQFDKLVKIGVDAIIADDDDEGVEPEAVPDA